MDKGVNRDISFFNQMSHQLRSVLAQFKKINFYRKDDVKQRSYEKTLSNFCYIIYRLLEEAKIFKIIFGSD